MYIPLLHKRRDVGTWETSESAGSHTRRYLDTHTPLSPASMMITRPLSFPCLPHLFQCVYTHTAHNLIPPPPTPYPPTALISVYRT